MTPRHRKKTRNGFLCTKYGCTFSSKDFCRLRAERNIDTYCQVCTGIQATEPFQPGITFSTKGMRRRKAA